MLGGLLTGTYLSLTSCGSGSGSASNDGQSAQPIKILAGDEPELTAESILIAGQELHIF